MRGILKHDLYSGFCQYRGKFLLGILFFSLIGIGANLEAESYQLRHLSMLEMVGYLFAGVMPFQEERSNAADFQIPIIWMILQIYIAYIVGAYPLQDLKSYGVNLLLRTRDRGKWWLGKVIWVVMINIVVYVIEVIVFTVIAVAEHSGGIFGIQQGIGQLCHVELEQLSGYELISLLFLLPFFTSVSISMLQLFFMFWVNEMAAYAVILFLCVAGAYYKSPFFLTNNSMLVRNITYLENGLWMIPAGVLLGVGVCACVGGNYVMKHKDIFEN